ncbi:MAG: DUF4175 family protein [Deltaproteobacteria bacterium]|nr:DUF4175 family protein [Deltaproteobacteria bacterium]
MREGIPHLPPLVYFLGVDASTHISIYLAEIRRRSRWLHALRGAAVYCASLAGLALLLLGAAAVARLDGALQLLGLGLPLVGLVALAVHLVVVFRRLRDAKHLAELVGERVPALRSDLVSSVELIDEARRGPVRFSTAMLGALSQQTAERLGKVDPRRVVASTGLRRAAMGLAAAAVAWAGALALAPEALREAAARLLRFELRAPEKVAEEPLVGDLRVTYYYPPHTGRPPRRVESSTGHLSGPPGTRALIQTTAMVPLTDGALVFEAREGRRTTRHPLTIVRSLSVQTELLLRAEGTYHFEVVRSAGERVRDPVEHRVELEPDERPRVTLYGPPEELEIAQRQKVELAYQAEDDVGLSGVELAYQLGSGPTQRLPLWKSDPRTRQRSAAGKHEWDLSTLGLRAGARVAYWIEAIDNDAVLGPKRGLSATAHLRVFSPEEKHQRTLQQQQELAEQALELLSGRLLLFGSEASVAGSGQLDRALALHRGHGRLVDGLRELRLRMKQDPLTPEAVVRTVAAIRRRQSVALEGETKLLKELEAAKRRGAPRPSQLAPVETQNRKLVTALELDALLLADLLEEQRLQGLVSLTQDLQEARKKLAELLARYKRSQSEQLKRELLREIAAMERKLQQLQAQLASLRSTVPDEYLNREALAQVKAGEELKRMSQLLQQGKIADVEAALASLDQKLARMQSLLGGNLQDYRGQRMSEREAAYGKLLDRVRDLEGQQRGLARRTEQVVGQYQKRATSLMQTKVQPMLKRALAKARKLAKAVEEVDERRLPDFQQEQLGRVRARVQGLQGVLQQGDLEQALHMAQRANNGLRTLKEDLADDLEGAGAWQGQALRKALGGTRRAQSLAAELQSDLETALPPPGSLLRAEDRQELGKLRRSQQTLRREAQQLLRKLQSEEAGARLLGPAARRSLRQSEEYMGQAAERLGAAHPQEAQGAQEEAADRLAQLQKQVQQSRQPRDPTGESSYRERVPIPGAETFRPPKEFRQDLLDAMKEKAPSRYRRMVKRYYEELVR